MAIAALAAILLAAPALAHDYNVGSLRIDHPWARATPKGASVGGGYLSITNTGSTPDTLIGGSSPVAKKLELHEMSMDKGIMKMRALPAGVEIKPGETVTFQPSGYHVMFVGLNQPLKQGERIPATLDFAKAGQVKVEFSVEGIGAMRPGVAGHDMPGMSGMSTQQGH
jgi:copper(I)-binding protein